MAVNATQGEDIVRLFAMVGTGALVPNSAFNDTSYVQNYYWNIKIRQIDCSQPQNPLRAPAGCLQYFTSTVGSIESFNWKMNLSPYPASTDYAICIKRPGFKYGGAFCGIRLNTATRGDGEWFWN